MDGFMMENPITVDDLGVPLFLETPTLTHLAVLDHEIKDLNLIFPTKYVIPKSLMFSSLAK